MRPNQRPLPEGYEKVTYRTHLELRYLRWDYFVKSTNPDPKVLLSKERMVRHCSRIAFSKYRKEFFEMGFEIEDVENIARVHAVSYIGLYSMHTDKDKMKKFVEAFKKKNDGAEPSLKDINKKEQYGLMSFIEQRMLELANLARSYKKGEAGYSSQTVFKQTRGDKWPKDDDLIARPGYYGWKLIGSTEYNKFKHKFQDLAPGSSVVIDGVAYRIATENTSLSYADSFPVDIYSTKSNSPPNAEALMIEMEDNKTRQINIKGVRYNISLSERIKNLIELYNQRPDEVKARILGRFISWMTRRNGFQEELKEEIAKVRRMRYSVFKKMAKERLKNA